ncbi:MAG: hypothetical protein Kow006_22730 [Gammaproteobacteria bacterium]
MHSDIDIEEIQLSASPIEEEGYDPQERPTRIRFQIQQSNPSRGIEKQVSVGDDQRVYVQDRAVRHHHRFTLPLTFLDPEPRRQLRFAAIWGYLALAALLVGVGHYLLVQTPLGSALPYPLLPLYILSGAFFLFFLIGLIYHSRYQYSYQTQHGKVELVTLLYGRPNRRQFRDFLARFSGAIREAQRQDRKDRNQRLASELREHRRLMESGVLSRETYETAKSRILASHGK